MTSSILDVAKEAKVSPSTVSLVLNGKPYVSSQTRSQVKAAVRKLRYKPRRKRKSHHIAVVYTPNMIVNGVLAEYCRGWITGIRESLSPTRSQMSIFAGAQHVSQDLIFTQTLEHRDCDGVIIMGAYPRHGYAEKVLETGLPLLAFARAPEHAEFSAITADHHNLAVLAIEHLTKLGHRRIALITGSANESYSGRMLRSGVQKALATTGVTLAYDSQANAPDAGPNPFAMHLDAILASGASAVFTGDPGALKLATIMESRGLIPGRDLSILGVDDMGLATPSGKRISSMGYNKQAMGQIAGLMMLQLLQMGDHISHQFTTVQPFLVPGQTLASPLSPGSSPTITESDR